MKQEVSQISLVERFVLQVMTGKGKNPSFLLSQEIGIKSLSGSGRRAVKTDQEKTVLQNLEK